TFVAALRKAKLLVVHARNKNALTDAADVVLPVTGLQGKGGTFVNAQGIVQRFDVAFLPPPIVRTDLEVLLHLGKRYGLFETHWTAREVFGEMKTRVAGYRDLSFDDASVAGEEPSISPAAAYDVLWEDKATDPNKTDPSIAFSGAGASS